MSRRCQHIYGGHLCPRPATLRLGVAIPGHSTRHWLRELCRPHADEEREGLDEATGGFELVEDAL